MWFGFPTGPKAEQGVRNLVLTGVHFKANDLKKGDHFMIMADHGTDWHIYDNKFTMVHKRNSHIFDLGSLQNSLFEKNQFIGYAPELVQDQQLLSKAQGHDFFQKSFSLMLLFIILHGMEVYLVILLQTMKHLTKLDIYVTILL